MDLLFKYVYLIKLYIDAQMIPTLYINKMYFGALTKVIGSAYSIIDIQNIN